MRVLIFYTLLAAVVVIAFWRGRRDEQLASVTCVAGTLATVAAGDALALRFASFDELAFLVDVGVLLSFVAIALRSDRFWPMWVAGLQLTATTVHMMMAIDREIPALVFGAALAVWSYPILLLIAIGAWRTAAIERWRRAIASGSAIT